MTSLLLLVISSLLLGSSSDECARSSVVVAPSSGPTVCLPLDDYIQLRQQTAADVVSDGETALPPTSASSIQSVSLSLLLYRYMSPLWLQTHANFTETPSSVSAQTIEFGDSGLRFRGVLFRVNLFEAGRLRDDKAYIIQLALFLTYPSGYDSDPSFHICDGNSCVGIYTADQNVVTAYSGRDSLSHCIGDEDSSPISAPQSSSNWNLRLEIHPNSTTGIVYVSTSSLAYEYQTKLKPSRGLHFKVCREDSNERHQFHLFELVVRLNE